MGDGTPTFTRASAATQIDFENLRHQVLSGEARFQGARRVYNELPAAQADLTTGFTKNNITVTTGVADPIGGTAAVTLTANANNPDYFFAIGGRPSGASYSGSYWVRRRTGTSTVSLVAPQTTSVDITASIDGTWRRFGTGVWTIGGTTAYVGLRIATSGDAVDVAFIQTSNMTGVTNQNSNEYVDPTVSHGAGALAVQYFSTLLGNITDPTTHIVTEATGAPIVTGASGVSAYAPVDAGGPYGFLSEGAATQLIATTADIRNMTTASWVNGGTLTIARTQVGADGAANTANLITGGAVAATNTVLLTPALAGASRTYSLLLMRGVGSGAVSLTIDGTNYTDISASLNTSTFKLVQITANVVPIIGLKITTNGDTVIADMNQLEAGTFASSRILTGAATRAADVLTYPNAVNIDGTIGTAYLELAGINASGGYALSVTTDGTKYPIRIGANMIMADGTSTIQPVAITPSATPQKMAATWGNSARNGFVAGVAGTAGAFDGDMNVNLIAVGHDGASANQPNSTIRNFRIYQQALPAARFQAMTT